MVVDEVLGVDTQVGQWIVEMSTAEQRVGRLQAAAAGAVRRQQVRSGGADVRELLVQTFSAVINSDVFVADCRTAQHCSHLFS